MSVKQSVDLSLTQSWWVNPRLKMGFVVETRATRAGGKGQAAIREGEAKLHALQRLDGGEEHFCY